MCLGALFPKPPDPVAPPPSRKPDPVVTDTKQNARKLIDPDEIAKVTYGSEKKRKRIAQPKIAADALRIKLNPGSPDAAAASQSGGLNVS